MKFNIFFSNQAVTLFRKFDHKYFLGKKTVSFHFVAFTNSVLACTRQLKTNDPAIIIKLFFNGL